MAALQLEKNEEVKGTLKVNVNKDENGLTISVSGHVRSVRFGRVFLKDDLVSQCGFQGTQTIKQIKEFIHGAFTRKSQGTSIEYMYVETCENTPNGSDKEKSEIKNVHSDYRKGDSLVLIILFSMAFMKLRYSLTLPPIQLSSALNGPVDGLETQLRLRRVEADLKVTKNELANLKNQVNLLALALSASKLAMQKKSMVDEEEKKGDEGKFVIDEQPGATSIRSRIGCIGVFQSSKTVENGSYRSWNFELVGLKDGLIQWQNESSQMVILENGAGLWHIHGIVEVNYSRGHGAVGVFKNKSRQVTVNGAYCQGNRQSISFDVTLHFNAGDFLRIYVNSTYDYKERHTLTVEKIQ